MPVPETLTISVPSWSAIASTLGLLGGFCYAVYRVIKHWTILNESVVSIGKTLTDRVLPELKEMGQRIAAMEPIIDMWKDQVSRAHSPRQLNEKGLDILEKSGIRTIVETEREKLLALVKAMNPTNAYDADAYIFHVMQTLPEHSPQYSDTLKTWAFNAGLDLQIVLYVGSVYLRDTIFPSLGFDLKDLDKAKPATPPDNK